jgi:tellurium resistance protein TerZ
MMILLQKEQKQSLLMLVKNAEELETVVIGAGWDAVSSGWFGGGSIDLDASVICFDEQKRKTNDFVYFGRRSCGAYLKHTGDDLTGDSSNGGDDEQIIVYLSKVPQNIHYMAVTLNSFRGQPFSDIKNAYARVFVPDGVLTGASLSKKIASKKELVKVELNNLKNTKHKGAVLAIIAREGASWSVKGVSATHENAQTFNAMWDVASNFI